MACIRPSPVRARYCNESLPLHVRLKAAIAAAPYVHPKLAVTALVAEGDFASRLDAARQRSAEVIEGRAELRALPAPAPTPMDAPMSRLRRF
jgi:hypothetical protein